MNPVATRVSLAAIAAIGSACTPERDTSLSALELAPGTWGRKDNPLATCESNPHTISFSEDKRLVYLRHEKPLKSWDGKERSTIHYRVEQLQPVLRLSLIGETRRTDDGQRVVWDLMMVSPDAYCWHRADWPDDECTGAIVRCPDPPG